jgi:hypothetical protein
MVLPLVKSFDFPKCLKLNENLSGIQRNKNEVLKISNYKESEFLDLSTF